MDDGWHCEGMTARVLYGLASAVDVDGGAIVQGLHHIYGIRAVIRGPLTELEFYAAQFPSSLFLSVRSI